MKDLIHERIVANLDDICHWFSKQPLQEHTPFYSSFDMRDGGYKITNVDANLFPAGFNNICDVDREEAPALISRYFEKQNNSLGSDIKVALLTEEHTKNAYYWENVACIVKLLEGAGMEVRLCLPRKMEETLQVESSTGKKMSVFSWWSLKEQGFEPDFVLSNNDFSSHYEDWEQSSTVTNPPVIGGIITNPPWQLGWRWRKKSDYFFHFNALAQEWAQLIDVDPWVFQVRTQVFSGFSLSEEESLKGLAHEIQKQIDQLSQDYNQRKIKDEPVVFVKNNSGTYGMGIVAVRSGEEFLNLNYKSRKKMKAAKGGEGISEVIIQEGVPSFVLSESSVAEPVLYLIGNELAGGFLRTHKSKGVVDNLNSPGAVYKRLCVSDLKINVQNCPLENVYGWVAKLGVLALAREIKSKGHHPD